MGGTKVDAALVSLLTKIFGSDFINKFKVAQPQQWLQFMTNFERSKRSFVGDGKTSIKLGFPFSFEKELMKYKGKDIEELMDEFGDSNISFHNGFFIIEHEKAKSLFSEQISQITSHVKSLMSDSKLVDLNYILLVGGFGECKMLQDACKKGFPKVKVLIPVEAQLAIIRGAVLFGHNPLQIQSRIARFTYGESISRDYIDGVHESSRIEIVDGEEIVKKCFEVFIEKGEEVETGKVKYFRSRPLCKNQTGVRSVFYKTERKDVAYVDEAGVTRLATAILTSPSGPLSNNIETRVTCGHTELLVEARDKAQGDEFPVKVMLDFH